MNREEYLDLVEDSMTSSLSRGRKILIVGTRDKNLPEHMTEDDRLIVYHNTNAKNLVPSCIPESVGVAIFTRFVYHKTSIALKNSAKKAGVETFGPLKIGEIRRLIELAFSKSGEQEAVVCPEEKTEEVLRAKRSEIKDFFLGRLNARTDKEVPLGEEDVASLLDEGRELWPETSLKRMEKILRSSLFQLGLAKGPSLCQPGAGARAKARTAEPEVKPQEVQDGELALLREKESSLQDELKKLQAEYGRTKGRERKLIAEIESLKRENKLLKDEQVAAKVMRAFFIGLIQDSPEIALMLDTDLKVAIGLVP